VLKSDDLLEIEILNGVKDAETCSTNSLDKMVDGIEKVLLRVVKS